MERIKLKKQKLMYYYTFLFFISSISAYKCELELLSVSNAPVGYRIHISYSFASTNHLTIYIPISTYLCRYLCMCLCIYVWVCVHINFSTYLSIYLFIYPFIHPSNPSTQYLPTCLPTYLHTHLSTYLVLTYLPN